MRKLIIALLALPLLAGCGERGRGEKNGTITKLGTSGVFCTTNEMEIVRGGLQGGTGVNGAAFDVTIEDPRLLAIAREAIKTGAEIQITYRTELISFCRSDSQNNFLTSIRIIRPGIAGGQAPVASVVPAGAGAPIAPALGTATAAGITNAQLQQMLDNQTRSIDQSERLVKAVETLSAK